MKRHLKTFDSFSINEAEQLALNFGKPIPMVPKREKMLVCDFEFENEPRIINGLFKLLMRHGNSLEVTEMNPEYFVVKVFGPERNMEDMIRASHKERYPDNEMGYDEYKDLWGPRPKY